MIDNARTKLFAVEVRTFGEADIIILDRSSDHGAQFHRRDGLSGAVIRT